MSVSPRTAAGELPRFYELDPLRFQELCRDLWQMEKEFEDVEVYGTSGQSQRGIDVLATRKDGKGLATGQCKRIVPSSFTAKLITDSVDEFLLNKPFWTKQGAKKFALFVASSATPRQIQDEKLAQIKRLKREGFKFELWSAAKITNKLRPHPGIVRTYLGEHWVAILCGTGMSGLSGYASEVMGGLFQAQFDTLASQSADSTAREVESLRAQWRAGKKASVQGALSRLQEPTRWAVSPSEVKATILRFEAQIRLEAGDVDEAKKFSSQAAALNPAANKRLEALLLRSENKHSEAIKLLEGSDDPETIALYSAFLLEDGKEIEALEALERASGLPEYHRLRALVFVVKGNLLQARLETQKAMELAGTWNAVIYTRAVVHYFSGVSPAALPAAIPQWPDPLDWSLVQTDDESRSFFKTASTAIATLESQSELALEDRRTLEAWRAACLANDPEGRTEAIAYCKGVLERDPGNHRVLAWTVARRLEIDIEPAREALRSVIQTGKPTPSEIVVAVACYVARGEYEQAKTLMTETEAMFGEHHASELRRFWIMQIDLLSGNAVSADQPLMDAPGLPDTQLLNLRIQAKQTGDWEPLLAELRSRVNAGSGEAALEICMILASQKKWKDAVPVALLMADRLKTAESIRLACIVLYNARSFQECLDLLDRGRSSFPHSQLPNDLARMKISVQSELGFLPAAVAAAEEIFQASATAANFLALARLYFTKGDLASLAILARKHSRFEELSSTELLRLAAHLADQDRTLAVGLWKRSMAGTIPDAEVTAAMSIGYRLGLDRQLRPLIERLDSLAQSTEGYVRRMTLNEARDTILARQSAMEDVYKLYRAGKIPIHLAAEKLNKPLAFWFHRLLLANEAAFSGSNSVFLRSGSRVGQTIKESPEQPVRLHADLTALLTAAHFDVLEKIESAFQPIVLSHDAVIALVAMSDDIHSAQPSRQAGLKLVNDLVNAGSITVCECPEAEPTPEADGAGHGSKLLGKARAEGWLLADWGPPLDKFGQPMLDLSIAESNLLRTPHRLVEGLRAAGEISEAQSTAALDILGPEHHPPSQTTMVKNDAILCSGGVLEWLATGGVLKEAVRTFRLHIDRFDLEAFIQGALANYEQDTGDAAWLSRLTERITKGLEAGTYQLLPAFPEEQAEGENARSSLDFSCLKDLFLFNPQPGDVIWIDDRCINRYFHRDRAAIIDTLDVLFLLRDRGRLEPGELEELIHRFRRAGARYLSLNEQEIAAWVQRAQIVDGKIIESSELRALRRNMAYSLVDCDVLTIASDELGAPVEWPFLLRSGAAILDALVIIWSTADPDDLKLARADWVLKNLYVPDRGRSFTNAERSGPADLQLEAAVLAGFLVGSFAVQAWRQDNRQNRRQFLNWIYSGLIRDRFDADPGLARTTVEIAKRLLLQSVDGMPGSDRRTAGVLATLLKAWLEDLPDPIRDVFGRDSAFCARLGVSILAMVQIGAHKIAPEKFWDGAVRALRTNATVEVNSDSGNLHVQIASSSGQTYLVVEDRSAMQRFELRDVPVGILSDSITERSAALTSIAAQLDLCRSAAEDAVARLAQIEDTGQRMEELFALRRRSLELMYVALFGKLRAQEGVTISDFVPEDATLATQHLRIDQQLVGQVSFSTKLESAGSTLLDDLGLTQALLRLMSLPVPLPSSVLTRLAGQSSTERRQTFRSLIRQIGGSPIATAHLIRLIGSFASDRPSYSRYRRLKLEKLDRVFDAISGEAWLEVLKYFAREFWYVNGFRSLEKDIRLAVVWSHADSIFRVMAQAGVDLAWIKTSFSAMSWKLTPEFVSGEERYVTDIANPDRLQEWPLALALIAYSSENGLHLAPERKAALSQRSLEEPGKMTPLFRDPTLPPNAMGSILCPDPDDWSGILEPQVVANVSAFHSSSNLRALIDAGGFEDGNDVWLALLAVVGDLPVPTELSEDVREALLRADYLKLCERDAKIGMLAIAFAAQHAAHFGREVIEKVRGWLPKLAEAFQRRGETEEEVKGQLLSAAFSLYSREVNDDRYRELAKVTAQIIQRWPGIAPYAKIMVDRMVEEIPNGDSRHLWRLQVELRRL
jgi:tetratricopeptide (TPR) repeat protein